MHVCVQSRVVLGRSFAARTLGRDESPPAERQREQNGVDPSGMNFAVGGAGVREGTHEAPKLGTQIEEFRRLVRQGIIDKDLNDSVALIAFSGQRDYARVTDMTDSEVSTNTVTPCALVYVISSRA